MILAKMSSEQTDEETEAFLLFVTFFYLALGFVRFYSSGVLRWNVRLLV